MANLLLKRIKDWATSITSFRTGDVIPVDGPSGTAKMSKDDLLKETAENALADNVVHAFDDTKNYIIGSIVEYNGIIYRFRQNHSEGPWNVNEVEQATIYEELKTTLKMSKNLLNPSAIYDGYFFGSQATFDEGTGKTANDNYACFKFDCKPNTTYCVTGTSFIVQLYRSDNVRVRSIGDYFNNHAFSFTTGPYESFFTISFKTYVYKTWEYMVVEGSTLPSKFEPYGKFVSGSEYKNMQDVYDVLSEITELKFPTNVYDGTHYSGKTMNSYGALSDNESRSVTGFIRVESGKKYFVSSNSVKCGFVRVVQFADDFSVVRNDTNAYDFTTEATTRYIRLCTTTALMEDKFMITSEGYVDYEAYEPIKVIPKVNAESAGEMTRIIVKADGSGDFSSLYDAVTYANSIASEDNEVDVVIVDTSTDHTGTEFDIFAEMYNSDVSTIPLTPKTFAGLPLNGYVNLIGVGKVKLLCHLPDDATLDQTTHMSVVDCNSAVYCENLTFEAKNCRYPFHDESLNLVPKTTHKFKNCKFTHLGNKAGQWASPHAIGIGFSEACKFEFVDCIFDSSASGGYPFLAHNYAPQLGTQITLTNCVMVGENSGTSIALEFNGYSPATSNPTKYYACFNDVFLSNIIATGNIHVYKTNSGYSCTNNYVVHNFTDLSVVVEPDWIVP